MTKYAYDLTLDDSEVTTLERALDMLKEYSAARIVANDLYPAMHDLATIPKIRDKIVAGAKQISGYNAETITIWVGKQPTSKS
jgi:collagenase-like PrtC family protease